MRAPPSWRGPRSCPATLRIEADPDRVQGAQQEAAPPVLSVGPIQLMTNGLDGQGTCRLGRERDRRTRDDPEAQAILAGAKDEVTDHASGPSARPDPEAGVAQCKGRAAAQGLAEGHREP